MSALISDCGKYRYILTRNVTPTLSAALPATVCFIMLNPSTADADHDDPTIRRCMGFAAYWGFSRLTVVNLFAYRATDPKELNRAENPIGDDNMFHVLREAQAAEMVVCAWGALTPSATPQAFGVLRGLTARLVTPYCLGKTRNAYPRHPLYVPKTQKPEVYP